MRPRFPCWRRALCILLGACQGRGDSGVVHIVPQAQGEAENPAPAAFASARTDPGNARPRISIDPRYTVLQCLNVNLDQDPDEEQVIAVKRITDVASPVRIIVVDADPDPRDILLSELGHGHQRNGQPHFLPGCKGSHWRPFPADRRQRDERDRQAHPRRFPAAAAQPGQGTCLQARVPAGG